MYCRDLVAEEDRPSYWEAVLYWLQEGEPARMDADRDGVPCEPAYPETLVRQFLEDPGLIDDPWRIDTNELESGMFCRDLIWWRPFYVQALGYFYAEGLPARMAADNNGIPCETVYDEVEVAAHVDRARDIPPGLTCEQLAEESVG